jgi:hypothetical protein
MTKKTYWLYAYNRETGEIDTINDNVDGPLSMAVARFGLFLSITKYDEDVCYHIVDNSTSNTVWHAGKDLDH